MGKVTFDKKQIPQVLGLGALSLGLFGWFGWKMITPPPTQAAAVVAPSTTSAAGSTTAAAANGKTGSGPDAADMSPDVAALIGAAAPTDDMRDPFVPGVIESAVKPAAP